MSAAKLKTAPSGIAHISLCIHHQIAALLTHSPKRILGLCNFDKAAI